MTEQYSVTEEPIWSGPCIGGPLHAREGASRFPKGFLLVDRPGKRAWIYDYVPWADSPTGGAFQVRIAEGAVLVEDLNAPKNRFRAAEESEFDVRAMDWGTGQ